MRRTLACVGVLFAVVLAPGALLAQTAADRMNGLGVSPQPVNPQGIPASFGQGQCLQARALSGVVASNDRDVILRFGRADFYRLKLTSACPALVEPGAQVVDIEHGSNLICVARDVELKVVAGDGAVSRCAAHSLNRMSKAELAAAGAPQER